MASGWVGLGWVGLGVWLAGRGLQPSGAISSFLQPQGDASEFSLKLDFNQLASNADQLTFHWQSCGNWQIVGWLLGRGLEIGA